jgi:hypothetical protein
MWRYTDRIFLASALAKSELSALSPCRFTAGERASGTHRIGALRNLRVSLDDMEKILESTKT